MKQLGLLLFSGLFGDLGGGQVSLNDVQTLECLQHHGLDKLAFSTNNHDTAC